MTEYNKVANSNLSQDEMTFKELVLKVRNWFRYLLSKWVIIVTVGLSGGIIGFIYGWFQEFSYTATTTFVLEENGGNTGMLGQYSGLASMVGVDIGGGGGGIFQGDNILELYESRTMIEKTLLSEVLINGKKQLLIDHYLDFKELRPTYEKETGLKDIRFNKRPFSRAQDSIMGITSKAIRDFNLAVTKPDKKLSIIKVEVKSTSEAFSKLFNDQIVKNVNDFYVQTKTKKASENVAILQHQTDSVRNVLNGAIYQSATIVDATPNLNPARQILRAPAQRAQVNAEANKLMLSELVKNLELARLSLRKETPLIQVVDSPVFPLHKARFGRVKGLIAGGLLFGFLIVFYFTLKLTFKNLLSGE